MRPINLQPPEARARAQARRRRVVMIGVAALYVVVLVLVGMYWRTKVTSAQMDLEAQQAVNAELRAQIAQLEGARLLKQTYDEGVENLELILTRDVAWGRLLNDLGRVIPDRVWLGSFNGQLQVSEENPAVVGQVTVNGTAFEYPDVASWLRTVDSDQFPALAGAWVNTASLGEIGEAEVVDFTSLAVLTIEAVSSRFEERVPEVPE